MGWGGRFNTAESATPDSSSDSAAAEDSHKRQAEQQRTLAEANRKADEATVARCKSDHDTYCNRGADHIRQAQKNRALTQCAGAVNQYGAPACRNN